MSKLTRFLGSLAVLALVGFAGCTSINAATPGAVTGTNGNQYLASSPTLIDGQSCPQRCDVNGNMLATVTNGITVGSVNQGSANTSANAWPVAPTIAIVDSDTLTTSTLSNGTTRVTLKAASGSLTTYLETGSFVNTSATLTYLLTIYSSTSGKPVDYAYLGPKATYTVDVSRGIKSQGTEGLDFNLDLTTSPLDVKCVVRTVQK